MQTYRHRYLLAAAIVFIVANLFSFALAESPATLDKDDINAFDRLAVFQYSKGQDIASDVTCYTASFTPFVFFFAAPSGDWLELGLLYAGSSAISFGTGELLKQAFPRDRPYMYFDDPPDDSIDGRDYEKSFPSRHTIMAFNGAGFTTAVFALKYPDSPYRVPAVVTAYGLAFATATLRVTGGSHFTSDVIAGALIGSATGYLVPWVNYRLIKRGVSLSASPAEMALTFRY